MAGSFAFGGRPAWLHLKLQLVAVADDGQQVSVNDLVALTKEHERLEDLGLTLVEAKALLWELQRFIGTP